MTVVESLQTEAAAAHAAVEHLDDGAVAAALETAGRLLSARRGDVLAANEADVEAAELDEGALDRLRLDEARIAAIERQLDAMAAAPALERELSSWTLPNGLRVSERRIPVGAVGA